MRLKDEFPAAKDHVYFNTAVMGLLPESTIKVVGEYSSDLLANLRGERGSYGTLEKWADSRSRSKELLARVIGAKKGEIACVPNCTTGINTIFNMLPVKPGDNIVSTDLEFPMGTVVVENQRRRGAETRFIKGTRGIVETEDFEKAVDDDTAIVYLDNPGWFNGLLFDLQAISEIAHDHGAYLVVDPTQSFGALEWAIDDWGVDFAATSTYKWLMGGIWAISAGFMYINSKHVDSFQPVYVSASTMESAKIDDAEDYTRFDMKPREGIGRFEIFPRTEISYVALTNSLKVLLDHGMSNVERQVKKVDSRLVDGLVEEGFELQTPVEEDRRIYLNVKLPDPGETVKKLADQGVVVSPRVGGVRISPHFYNTVEEAEVLLEKLMEVV
jgi:cysteine desulfurase/selenocysteine lyase